MISIITGLPGAGKTSWLVERVLMPLATKNWEEQAIDSDGNKVTVKRRLFTNVKGLLLDHELIGDDELNSWPDWVKPGDIIVFDEIQKPWPKVPAGSKKPNCISELETHRHYGIDIYGLTQHPYLINDALIRLASQHKHVRKVGNSRYATVYEWDGVSGSLLYKNSVSKKPWRRSKEVEKMYRSSALHTKQKRSLPTVMFVLLIVLVGLPIGFYSYSGKFKDRYFSSGTKPATAPGVDKPASSPAPAAADLLAPGQPGQAAPGQSRPGQAPGPTDVAKAPVFSGCARIRERCQCFDTAGAPVAAEKLMCEDMTRVAAGHGKALDLIKQPQTYQDQAYKLEWGSHDSTVLANAAKPNRAVILSAGLNRNRISDGR
jgi:zona occludens toxin